MTVALSTVVSWAPAHPDVVDALEAYVQAAKAADRARELLARAERLEQQREAQLRAVCERVSGEGSHQS